MMNAGIYIVNTAQCADVLSRPERFSSPGRLSRCASMGSEARRLQGFAAELALSFAISGERLAPPVYRYEKSGRPVLEEGFVSLSHSGDHAVCAYSPAPVGVDIEVVRAVKPSLAARILSPRELEEFRRGAEEHYLLRKFIVKEACLKMTGEGLGGGMSSVEETDGAVFRDGAPAAHARFFFGSGFIGCVVSQEPSELPLYRLVSEDGFVRAYSAKAVPTPCGGVS